MMPEDKIRTTVDIFGTTYKMVGTFSQTYMKRISAYVNENMESIAKANPRLDSQKVAVLALISMADEFFRLQAKWDAYESEHSQSKQRIEELRKAFELTEEKERGMSGQVAKLQQRIDALSAENERLVEEAELASMSWAERVAEWEAKYNAAASASASTIAALESRIAELEAERVRREEALAASEAASAEERKAEGPAAPAPAAPSAAAGDEPADPSLLEKYHKLQEEYAKLQTEFNEWIQLTQSETQ